MTGTWNVDETKVMTRREVAAVLEDLKRLGKRSVNQRLNLTIFRLATGAGLRASEIAGLTMDNVRLGGDTPYIYVPKGIAKGGKARRVPLWDSGTRDDLAAWKQERTDLGAKSGDPFVCAQSKAASGASLDRRNLRIRFIRACKVLGKARQDTLTIHHGRHTFISHIIRKKDIAKVKDAAGHANIATTSLYTHVLADDNGPVELY